MKTLETFLHHSYKKLSLEHRLRNPFLFFLFPSLILLGAGCSSQEKPRQQTIPPKYGYRGTQTTHVASSDVAYAQDNENTWNGTSSTNTATATPSPTPETTPTPIPSNNPFPSATPTPQPTVESAQLLYGTPVAGKPGFVTSPYAPNAGYVDVRGFPPGTEVKDPYSGRVFLVP